MLKETYTRKRKYPERDFGVMLFRRQTVPKLQESFRYVRGLFVSPSGEDHAV